MGTTPPVLPASADPEVPVPGEEPDVSRPRDPDLHGRILTATRDLVARHGAQHLTIDAIAREAGVGRPAIYRRFAGKAEILEALEVTGSPPVPPVDTGTFAGDIEQITALLLTSVGSTPRPLIGSQLGHAIADDQAAQRVLGMLETAALPSLRLAWARGVARGEVDPGLDFGAAQRALVGSLLFSVLLYRVEPGGPAVSQMIGQWVRGVSP